PPQSEHGYPETNPPLLVRDDTMFGTAQLPKFAEDQFEAVAGLDSMLDHADSIESLVMSRSANAEGLNRRWLIPTAEVPLTNLVRDDIVDEASLPMRVTAGTSCFRAEAGAAGAGERSALPQHQFSKVELVSITTPEQSAAEHE